MITGHGNNIYQFESGKIEIDFSSNIAFNNNSEVIQNHLIESMDVICNYPDPEAHRLRQAIAEHHNTAPSQILVTNGSAEAFYLVAYLLSLNSSCTTAIATPSFAEYEDSCKLYGHEIDYLPTNTLLSRDLSRYNSVWLGAPNNPDGFRVSCDEIHAMAAAYPDCCFVIDRAYNELSTDEECDEVIPQNMIIINSFTKAFGIPGLRLGYIIADEAIISRLESMRPPWSVNSLSLVAGEFIIANYKQLMPSISQLVAESLFLQEEIGKLPQFRVTPSRCNFFLCEIVDGATAAELQEYLLRDHKILIRNGSNFRGLTPMHFRIAAQCREDNILLINALKQWR